MDLAEAMYDAVGLLPRSERFELNAQMRSAAMSIPSNIAEGKGRSTDRDYRSFLVRARGSLFELETHIEFAKRRKFIDETTAESLLTKSAEVGRKIGALIRYLDECIGGNRPKPNA